jgi:hypothetical protein
MSDLEFRFDDADHFARKMAAAPKIVEREMVNATNRITKTGERWAKELAVVKTGQMRRTTTAEPAKFAGGVVTGKYGTNAKTKTGFPYPMAVEFGRRGFSARPGKYLRFEIGGRVIYTKRVGPAKARPFMRPSLERLRPLVPREYRAALQRALHALAAAR